MVPTGAGKRKRRKKTAWLKKKKKLPSDLIAYKASYMA